MYKLRKRISKGYYKVMAFLLARPMKNYHQNKGFFYWLDKNLTLKREEKRFIREIFYYLDNDYHNTNDVLIYLSKSYIPDDWWFDIKVTVLPDKFFSEKWRKRNGLIVTEMTFEEYDRKFKPRINEWDKKSLRECCSVVYRIVRKGK